MKLKKGFVIIKTKDETSKKVIGMQNNDDVFDSIKA
jgi:hypothetical protein